MPRNLGRPYLGLLLACSTLGLSCPPTEVSASAAGTDRAPKAPRAATVQVVSTGSTAATESVEIAATELSTSPVSTDSTQQSTYPPAPVEAVALPDESDAEPDMTARESDRSEQDDDAPRLGAIVKETWIFAKPNWKARKIGYLRAGAVVKREADPAGYAGCEKGWYRIVPRGYACVGSSATLDRNHPVLEVISRRPNRTEGLPYPYVLSRSPPPPLYLRLPSEDEQRMVEPDLKAFRGRRSEITSTAGSIPTPLLYGGSVPSLGGPAHSRQAISASRPVARSGFALLETFEWTDRVFGLTTELTLLPLDRMRAVKISLMKGISLDSDSGLPAAFVRSRHARRFRIDPVGRTIRDAGALGYREGVALTGHQVRVGGEVYFEARDGSYLREKDNPVMIHPLKAPPGWALQGRKWIDVSILKQTLIAFEGTRPVYATLVSTGVDGVEDPKETHSTVQGVFMIHTKHVSVTMDGDDVGDEFDLRDVPYVQYFTEGYAVHGAYWHDEFGTPRSHGCVNVSPLDAAWLFAWTDPQVPEGWHGYLQPRGGTIVYTHP